MGDCPPPAIAVIIAQFFVDAYLVNYFSLSLSLSLSVDIPTFYILVFYQ